MFKPILERIVTNCPGAAAACVMGIKDGIGVETVVRDKSVDPQALGAEFSFILTQVQKAAEALEVGKVEEVVIRSQKLTYAVRLLSDDFFIGLVVLPDGNFGKGRYLMRQATPQLQANL